MKTNPFRLPELGYQLTDLAPMMSQQTLSCHYGKHFQTYIDNLNRMVNGSHFEGLNIEDVVRKAPEGPMANNAGQVLNHQLFFEQFLPAKNAKMPSGDLLFLIEQSFGSFGKMREAMDNAAKQLFGSGWVWLTINAEGKMQVLSLPNGDNPLRHGLKPLLTIDLWEHAYYLDYQNRKDKYLENFWLLVNWHVVSKRLV
ncbi:MAG: superoxide dismutase [Paludibacteraceae bacterium]|jgi:Fe-Mn family superoxide dismutase|nr:superoxide dismutase [Paludibacteraceae bacterium]